MSENTSENIFEELREELSCDILPFWEKRAVDFKNGGFFGAIGNDNEPLSENERTVVMASRFLWTYSRAALLLKDASKLKMADYARSFLTEHFWDKECGGWFWSVQKSGEPRNAKKQIYGNAFALYAMSENAAALLKLRGDKSAAENAMRFAEMTFRLLEEKARDKSGGGYFEAFERDWSWAKETRLSDKDINCDKSMNTNLHVMEALTNYLRVIKTAFPEKKAEAEKAGEALYSLIKIHLSKIVNGKKSLEIYFDRFWNVVFPQEISFGHNIEASWLLWEAAETLGDEALKNEVRGFSCAMARAALEEGFDKSFGAMDNSLSENGKRDRTRIWWTQAESLVGFYNAWSLSNDEAFRNAALAQWEWIKRFQIDKKNGEWFSEVSREGVPNLLKEKGGNWKTSYHNARCCMELISRMRRAPSKGGTLLG